MTTPTAQDFERAEEIMALVDWVAADRLPDRVQQRREIVARALADERERAALWHEERATLLRVRASNTRSEWCGPDIPDADRRSNYADSRKDDERATFHDECATAFRAGDVE